MRQPNNSLRVKILERDKPNKTRVLISHNLIKVCNLVYEWHFLSTDQIYRFMQKSEKKSAYLEKLLMKLWREGYIEKFKMVMEGSSYATNFYLLGTLGKKILLERNFKDYDLNFLENYEVVDEVHFHSFEHHYLVAEFASLEHMILEGNEIMSKGEMKADIYYGENKNLTIKPDFATLLQRNGGNVIVNSEFEVSVKSPLMKKEKLSKYVSYKEISGDDFLLRFIFSNPIREIGYWSWTKREYPKALEELKICSTCMNLINDENDLLKEIYYFPTLENVPHIPVGTNRWDERFEVKRNKLLW